MAQTVHITGCSSGFGKVTTQTFQDAGWNVVATVRAPERAPEFADHDRMLVFKLDCPSRTAMRVSVRCS